MKIKKRSGHLVDANWHKLTEHVKHLANLEPKLTFVDPSIVTQKTISGLYDGVTTVQINELLAENAAMLSTKHYEYSYLASRILVANLHKNTPKTFGECVDILYNNKDAKTGEDAPLVSDKLIADFNINKDFIERLITPQLDYERNYFGLKTLYKSYLIRSNGNIVETPQYMYMRVAIGIHGLDIVNIEKTYLSLANGYYTHATPTLFNSGTPKPQMSSCFLLTNKEDSLEGIMDTAKDVATISAASGGIGLAIHNIRATGSYIKGSGGTSKGLIPLLKTYNELARWWDQGGNKRKGSFAMYLEPWHADVFDFLDIRKNTGKEELRARELFPALWIPDLFMQRVEADENWTLMCPNECPGLSDVYGDEFKLLYERYEAENKGRKTIKAQELWTKILDSQIETGTPFVVYKDAANKKSNQKNLGTIKSSNLCVAAHTEILTDEGYKIISSLENQNVKVWNGTQFSDTIVRKTGENVNLHTFSFSNGSILDCTPYHKFYVKRPGKNNKGKLYEEIVNAEDLIVGDRISRFSMPAIDNSNNDFLYPYTHGLYCADGHDFGKHKRITLYGSKIDLYKKGYINLKTTSGKLTTEGSLNLTLYPEMENKYKVPLDYSLNVKLDWFAGYCDGDGHSNGKDIEITAVNKEFLENVKKMLDTMGVNCKLTLKSDETFRTFKNRNGESCERWCKSAYRLYLGGIETSKLLDLGLDCKRLNLSRTLSSNRQSENYIKVIDIERNTIISDTYCVNEPLKHKAVFNGILTGNCTEILEYTSPTEQAVCNLASIAVNKCLVKGYGGKLAANSKSEFLGYFFDHDLLYDLSYELTINLNRVIDSNHYPTPETKLSNLKHRPIGIGIQGLADTFAMMNIAFDSEEAKELNDKIFETIYFASLTASKDLAIEKGPYDSFEGSPASKGILQYDMWNKTEEVEKSSNWNWKKLKVQIVKYGIRNSLLLAPMPTASTASILGNNECFEPYTSNLYTRRVLSGEFIMVNKHLVDKLISLDLWNDTIINKLKNENGSVQNIPEIPTEVKEVFKTVWEISQKKILEMAADRGKFICQSQSMNVFMENANFGKLTSMHFYGWKLGLKTGMYYLRTKAAADAIKFTAEKEEIQEQISCSLDNPDDCEMCGA